MATNSRFQKLLFVINPISGDVDKSDLEDAITEYCRMYQLPFKIYKTSGQEDFKKLKDLLSTYEPDAVFAAGGDGTVSLTARVVKNSEVPLGIIPVGSGNGLSKDL